MDPAVEDVAFLARSPNRVAVLRALADGSLDRHDLTAAVDASRITVGRVVGDLEARNWVRREGSTYETTRLGRLVLDAFDELTAATRLSRKLGPLAEDLSTDFVDVDLRRFADAEIVRTTDADPYAVARIAAARMAGADHVRMLAHAVTSDVLDAQVEAARAGQVSTVVLDPTLAETIRDDAGLSAGVRDLLATGRARVVAVAESIPMSVGVYDDETVMIGFTTDGFPRAGLVTSDEAVVTWARETHDRLRCEGSELTSEDFPE